jgi:hypothetical protein
MEAYEREVIPLFNSPINYIVVEALPYYFSEKRGDSLSF